MFEKLTAEDLLELFGLKVQPGRSMALADAEESLTVATYLLGRSRYRA